MNTNLIMSQFTGKIDPSNIRNVYCIGRNYRMHAAELGNEVPQEPMVFMKPSHAVHSVAEGTLLPLPLHLGAVHHEVELVLHIGTTVQPGMTADEAVDGYALGIDFTLRDVQEVLKRKGHPWMAAKGVLHSAPITHFLPYPGTEALLDSPFSLLRNGEAVQSGTARDMLFSIDVLINHIAEHYGLGAGDIIFTGTPAGVGPIEEHDELVLKLGEESVGSIRIAAKPPVEW